MKLKFMRRKEPLAIPQHCSPPQIVLSSQLRNFRHAHVLLLVCQRQPLSAPFCLRDEALALL